MDAHRLPTRGRLARKHDSHTCSALKNARNRNRRALGPTKTTKGWVDPPVFDSSRHAMQPPPYSRSQFARTIPGSLFLPASTLTSTAQLDTDPDKVHNPMPDPRCPHEPTAIRSLQARTAPWEQTVRARAQRRRCSLSLASCILVPISKSAGDRIDEGTRRRNPARDGV